MIVKVLIAEDDRLNRRLLEVSLTDWGYEVTATADGTEAWEVLQGDDAPPLAILDWMMPGMDGPEVCRRVREMSEPRLTYIILLTVKDEVQDVVAGLEAGADDYMIKPFDPLELRTRVGVGSRILSLQQKLVDRAREMETMRARIAEQERFSRAVSQMSDAIVTLDEQWRLTTANRAACRLLNLDADEWLELPLDDVLAPFVLSVPLSELRAGTEHMSMFEISRPGTHLPLLLDARLTRVSDASDRFQSAVLVIRDVTDERMLRHVQAGFMTAAPHKLVTPVSLLHGYLGLTRHLEPDELLKEWPRISEVWDQELRNLNDLVQKLLDFEHLSELELEADPRPVDIAAVAQGAIERVRGRYPDQDAELALDVAPEAARVSCSAEHLQFILEELFGNALKFADKQISRVTLAVNAADEGRVRFTVTDNGPGIPHEYYDRVFDGFVQIEEHVTGQIPGWGVGLRMVRDVVSAYGGDIDVASHLGEGTSFTFTLPAAT
ncbi:MAG TPA: hypothetical protein DGT21_17550 [Armatimonadetes bacterium]|jgi:PAS domain S-box-containing protein|nr:hypothetical protein [Armatimonadota bacterium]